MEERSIDRLARYTINAVTIAIILGLCWFFRSVLIYIILAAVLAFVGRPLYVNIRRIHIRNHHIPEWLAAALTIFLLLAALLCIVTLIIPVISNVISDISKSNIEDMAQAISIPLSNLNHNLIHTFPKLGYDFRIEEVVYDQFKDMLSMSTFSSAVGSVASFLASIGIGLFSMVFISFFFIREPKMFSNIVCAFVPSKYEKKVRESLDEIGTLISRYFVGVFTEILGVSLINFLGLYIIARMGFRYSIGIAIMTGLFNVVPYVGPLLGGALGLTLALTIKYVCATSFGLAVSLPAFIAIVIGIFVFTQLIDNYVFQPLIYSSSIKAHPLEIFIVLLMAGHIGGILGMLVAIPSYTVARVIAIKFFSRFKPVQKLSGEKAAE